MAIDRVEFLKTLENTSICQWYIMQGENSSKKKNQMTIAIINI